VELYHHSPKYLFIAWLLIKQEIRLHDAVPSQAQGQLYLYFYLAVLDIITRVPEQLDVSIFKTESYYELLVAISNTAQCRNLKDHDLNLQHSENFKSGLNNSHALMEADHPECCRYYEL
jgi:hypothetical protein